MSKSKIEWTDEVWNIVTGCTKVSQGCKNCYAEREWPRMTRLVPAYAGRAFSDVRCHPERLDRPLHWKRPRRIFVNSMSDLFHPDVPFEFIDKVFAIMAMAPQHTFQILTKRPERMRDYLTAEREHLVKGRAWEMLGHMPKRSNLCMAAPWPLPNVHLGVSIEDQPTADARVIELIATPAAVHWASAEPLLGPIDLNRILVNPDRGFHVSALHEQHDDCYYQSDAQLDWVVVGGESGPNARPMNPQWARNLRDQCAAAGVPFLHKQNGEFSTPITEQHKSDFAEGKGFFGTLSLSGSFENRGNGVIRVGKKAAGRLLDGVLHDAYPEVK